MSAELLINLEGANTHKSIPNDKNSSKVEKKEGFSLFDALVNEAKNDSKDDDSALKNKSNETNLKSESTAKKTDTTPSTLEKNEIKTTSNKSNETIQNKTEIPLNALDTEDTESKDSKSLKVMVDKLVDIIVSSAKELFDKNEIKGSTNTEAVKNKINQLLENKITGNVTISGLKSEVNKLLNTEDITQDKKELISAEIGKIIKKELSKDISIEEIKITIDEKIGTIKESVKNIIEQNKEIKVLVDKPKEKVNTEISTAKDKVLLEVTTIKKETTDIQKEIKKLNTVENKEIKETSKIPQTKDIQEKPLVEVVDSKIDKIQLDSDDIIVEIGKIKPKITKEVDKKENLESVKKIDLKIETISKDIKTIEEVSQKIIVKTTNIVENEILTPLLNEETKNSSKSMLGLNSMDKNTQDTKNPLLATMFLNSQKTEKEKTSMIQIKDAKNNIIENKTVEAVKQSASKLNLKVEDSEVSQEGDEIKKDIPLVKKDDKNSNILFENKNLNRIFINQKAELNTTRVEQNPVILTAKETSEIIEKDKKSVEVVEISVAKEAVQVLQNKIIGAQQKMGSFMSEVARNMYLNYKPPVTALRVNLNPANLGTISIIMKANKVDNSLSVSMNLSNSNTMESFIENKAVLQNAIQRQFNESSNLTIDFGMQDHNSDNNFNEHFNENNNSNTNGNNSENNTEENIEEQEIVENNDYM